MLPCQFQVQLTCIVECSPLCSINWYKNNSLIVNSTFYKVIIYLSDSPFISQWQEWVGEF